MKIILRSALLLALSVVAAWGQCGVLVRNPRTHQLDCTGPAGSGSGSVTSVSFTGGIISVANPTTTPAFTVAGTSGGVPCFTSASTWASSAALTATSLILGGGAGVCPSTTSTDLQFASHTLTGGASSIITMAAGKFILPTANTAGTGIIVGTVSGTSQISLDTTYTNTLYPQLAVTSTYTAGATQIFVPSATTEGIRLTGATRPSAPTAGALNVSLTGAFEWYDGSAWQVAGSASALTSLTGDVAATGPGSAAATVVNLPTGVTMAGRLLATAIAAPSTPAAGKANIYVDSTSKTLCVKNDAGTVTCTGDGGSGDVVGPSSATDNAVVRFDSTTGKLVQNSLFIIDDSGNATTPGTISVGGATNTCDGTAGCLQLGQGTAPSGLATTGIQDIAPTSVTSYRNVRPGTVGASGVDRVSVSGTTATHTFGLIVAADITSATITGTQLAASLALTTPKVNSITDANGNPFLISSATASAVDSVTVTNAATANPATVTIGATGSDSNINLSLVGKGTGGVQFPNGAGFGSTPPSITFGTGGGFGSGEGTAPSAGLPAASVDGCYADSTAHAFKCSFNNDTASQIARYVDKLSVFGATTSAELAGVISDENGSGKLIFAAGTLAIASGKTFTSNNTLTITATDGITMTTPTTSFTAARTDAANTFTGVQTFSTRVATTSLALALADQTSIHGLTVPSAVGSATVTQTICSGTVALGTSAISSGAKASTVTMSCTGAVSTDIVRCSSNADISAVTGYAPSANGTLGILPPFATADTVNVIVENNTSASVTPGAVTLNCGVWR